MKAVILFSHGSTLCGAGTALYEHAERLRCQFTLVEIGYMNYSAPTFEESLTKVTSAGATEVIVVPFFLVPGYFVSNSLPDRVDLARQRYPELVFTIVDPLGADPLLADALIDSALNPLREDQWREGLNIAARQCRYSPECPIYGTVACPPTMNLMNEAVSG